MRLKLSAGNLVIVLLVGLGSYLVVRTQLRAELVRELQDGIGDDSELFVRQSRPIGAPGSAASRRGRTVKPTRACSIATEM